MMLKVNYVRFHSNYLDHRTLYWLMDVKKSMSSLANRFAQTSIAFVTQYPRLFRPSACHRRQRWLKQSRPIHGFIRSVHLFFGPVHFQRFKTEAILPLLCLHLPLPSPICLTKLPFCNDLSKTWHQYNLHYGYRWNYS